MGKAQASDVEYPKVLDTRLGTVVVLNAKQEAAIIGRHAKLRLVKAATGDTVVYEGEKAEGEK